MDEFERGGAEKGQAAAAGVWDGRRLGQMALSLLVGALLMLGGIALTGRVGPAPIVVVPPAPTERPPPTATPGPVRVYVNGAVARPEIYILPPDALVREAIEAAGGFTDEALADAVNLAQPLVDGLQVYVPLRGEASLPAPASGPSAAAAGPAVPQIVDLNRATASQLETLPGIGPSTAARIIAFREENGPFTAVDDLLQVPGIGPAKLEAVRGVVTVER